MMNKYRIAYKNVRLIVIDEISMIGAKILEDVNERLLKIKNSKELFGGLHAILCGDLHQLPAVRQTQVYQRLPDQ